MKILKYEKVINEIQKFYIVSYFIKWVTTSWTHSTKGQVYFYTPFNMNIMVSAKTLCGQLLDVNMVNEPKAHVTKLKAQKRKEKAGEHCHYALVQPQFLYREAAKKSLSTNGQAIKAPSS